MGGEGDDRDEMVEWHHQFNGHEFDQAPGDSEGQGSLVWCSSWGCKESDMTEQLNKHKQKQLECKIPQKIELQAPYSMSLLLRDSEHLTQHHIACGPEARMQRQL